jgi:hypothetical protein
LFIFQLVPIQKRGFSVMPDPVLERW